MPGPKNFKQNIAQSVSFSAGLPPSYSEHDPEFNVLQWPSQSPDPITLLGCNRMNDLLNKKDT